MLRIARQVYLGPLVEDHGCSGDLVAEPVRIVGGFDLVGSADGEMATCIIDGATQICLHAVCVQGRLVERNVAP
jgi:hypothetical protein